MSILHRQIPAPDKAEVDMVEAAACEIDVVQGPVITTINAPLDGENASPTGASVSFRYAQASKSGALTVIGRDGRGGISEVVIPFSVFAPDHAADGVFTLRRLAAALSAAADLVCSEVRVLDEEGGYAPPLTYTLTPGHTGTTGPRYVEYAPNEDDA